MLVITVLTHLVRIVISCVLFQYVEEEEFVDTIKALSCVKKEHTMFTDTHL